MKGYSRTFTWGIFVVCLLLGTSRGEDFVYTLVRHNASHWSLQWFPADNPGTPITLTEGQLGSHFVYTYNGELWWNYTSSVATRKGN